MKIEDGKSYKRRDGRVVGPAKKTNDIIWPFWIPSDNFRTYRRDGMHELTGWIKSDFDLVAEA